ncbi:hypothetical protein [Isobaculum melis]|uniref:Uncharacterized protein n=1 Tax=Isobaculum melis TaxID=142588 RepID=A0A1H9TBN6_9LACT|nr:hypothetical protein [Isobaculum melis]SER94665.1 hypothetical protein SAMN04488559_11223 [Isobaculum melis]
MLNQIKADSYHLLQHKKWLLVPPLLMIPILFIFVIQLLIIPMFTQYFQEVKRIDQEAIIQLEKKYQTGTISFDDSFKLEMVRSIQAGDFSFDFDSDEETTNLASADLFATRQGLLNHMQSTVGFVAFVMMIVVILFFAEDFTTNSIRNIFTYQFDKWRYFLNKWIFGALIALFLLFSYHLLNFIVSLFLFPIDHDVFRLLEQLLKVTVAQYPLFLTQFSLAFALIFITRKKSIAILLAFISPVLLAFLLDQIVTRLHLPTSLNFKPFLYLTQYGQGEHLTLLPILQTLVGSSIVIICYALLGWLGFSRYINKQ